MSRDYFDYLPAFVADMNPDIFLSNNFITLDFETNNQGDNRSPDAIWSQNDTVCVAWVHGLGVKGEEKYIRGGVHDVGELIDACYKADYLVAHNGKFDLKWLIRAGIDPAKVVIADTMLAEYSLTGNLKAGKKGALALGTLTKEYMGVTKEPVVDKMMKGGVDAGDIPAHWLRDRVRSDIFQTRDLWLILRDRLFNEGVHKIFYTKSLLLPVLADIEMNGVHLDKEAVLGEHETVSRELADVEAELNLLLEGRNPKSPKQMQEFIYDVLKFPVQKKGQHEWRPTGNADIEKWLTPAAKTKKQRKFIELKARYGKLAAAISKNLDYFKGVVLENEDCIFYAQFNQAQTVTHRLSSSGISRKFDMFPKPKSVQFQNFPRSYKRLISARHDGWYIIESDGAQIEFRVAGYVAQDVRICQDIVNGVDVHKFTASVLNHCTEEEVDKAMRTAAKAETFKPVYGGQFGSDEQMAYYASFREKYAELAKTQVKWETHVLRNKKITHETGITFHYPNAKVTGSGYNPEFPSICNYPVQNLATGEVIPIALVAKWHIMKAKKMKASIVNTVHDSAVTESPREELEELYEIDKWCFLWWVYEYLDAVYGIKFNVPLGVGYQAGTHWGTGKELYFEPSCYSGEFLTVDGGEITVNAVPVTKMKGVDYSRLITGD